MFEGQGNIGAFHPRHECRRGGGVGGCGGLAGQNYWVWDHDPEYQWAILALPNKSDWWIWRRSQNASAAERERLLARARALGMDMSRVVSTGD